MSKELARLGSILSGARTFFRPDVRIFPGARTDSLARLNGAAQTALEQAKTEADLA